MNNLPYYVIHQILVYMFGFLSSSIISTVWDVSYLSKPRKCLLTIFIIVVSFSLVIAMNIIFHIFGIPLSGSIWI